MINARQAQVAFWRLYDPGRAEADRIRDQQLVASYLSDIEAVVTGTEAAVQYWQTQAQSLMSQNSQLHDRIIQMRGALHQLSGENAEPSGNASTLCDVIQSCEQQETVDRQIESMRAALSRSFTHRLAIERQESVRLYDVRKVLERMFSRMRTGEKLAKAAINWVVEQLERRCPRIDDFADWKTTNAAESIVDGGRD